MAPSRNSSGTGVAYDIEFALSQLNVPALTCSDPTRQPRDIDVGNEALAILDPIAAGISEELSHRRRPAGGLIRRGDHRRHPTALMQNPRRPVAVCKDL